MKASRHIILSLAFLLVASSCHQKIPRSQFDARQASAASDAEFADVSMKHSVNPAWLKPPMEPYRLGPGDVLEIEVAEVPDTLARTFIMPDGMAYYNLAGGVRAEGLTLQEFKQELTKALKRDYTNPLVNLSLVDVRSRRYWMLGRISQPGIFPLSQPTTLLEAIANSGGLATSGQSGTTEELADLSHSLILRDGNVLPVDFVKLIRSGDTSQNIYLRHNDFIYIPAAQASSVLLMGAVKAPRSVSFKDSLTLAECIAQGGGPAEGAYTNSVVIVRGSMTKPRAATVDLNKILTGKTTDFGLKPGDIVWIPRRPFSFLESTVELIFRDAARTIAVNEGARAVGSNDKATLTVPIGGGGN